MFHTSCMLTQLVNLFTPVSPHSPLLFSIFASPAHSLILSLPGFDLIRTSCVQQRYRHCGPDCHRSCYRGQCRRCSRRFAGRRRFSDRFLRSRHWRFAVRLRRCQRQVRPQAGRHRCCIRTSPEGRCCRQRRRRRQYCSCSSGKLVSFLCFSVFWGCADKI